MFFVKDDKKEQVDKVEQVKQTEKQESAEAFVSANNRWERLRVDDNSNNPVSFRNATSTYQKLNSKGELAKKGVHENIFREGRQSLLKIYQNENGERIIVKTIKAISNDAKNCEEEKAKKLIEVGEVYDYVLRRNKNSEAYNLDMIMKFLEGKDLFDVIEPINYKTLSLLDATDLVCLAKSTVHAVVLCHKELLRYHFDIKPENFFISTINGRTEIQLIDFEMSYPCDRFGEGKQGIPVEQMGGTIEYAPPEVFGGRDYITDGEKIDFHCLGITLAAIFNLLSNENCIRRGLDDKTEIKLDFNFDRTSDFNVPSLTTCFYMEEADAKSLVDSICLLTEPVPENRKITLEKIIEVLDKIYKNLTANFEQSVASVTKAKEVSAKGLEVKQEAPNLLEKRTETSEQDNKNTVFSKSPLKRSPGRKLIGINQNPLVENKNPSVEKQTSTSSTFFTGNKIGLFAASEASSKNNQKKPVKRLFESDKQGQNEVLEAIKIPPEGSSEVVKKLKYAEKKGGLVTRTQSFPLPKLKLKFNT